MIGIYFSGTGNTKHCVTRLVKGLDKNALIYSIEDKNAIASIINSKDTIIFGYPIQFSNLPKIVYDFIKNNSGIFKGKNILIIATMGLFSGDGTGCSARLFKRFGANVVGGLHIKMPDCIGDTNLLKKTKEQNRFIISEANNKIDNKIKQIQNGKYPKEGLNFLYHMAGLFGQRLYFPNKTKRYFSDTKVDYTKCINCGLCVKLCPMNNIENFDGKVFFKNQCTMCYRCFSNCPQKAITLLGKSVIEQCKFENYLEVTSDED